MPTPEQTAKRMTYDPAFDIGVNVRDMMAAHIAHAIKNAITEERKYSAAFVERFGDPLLAASIRDAQHLSYPLSD